MAEFVHLHVHTHYSLLNSTVRLPALMARLKELGMSAVAITDSNNLCAAVEFQKTAHQAGIRPIIGCEQNLTLEPYETSRDPQSYHVTLLAKDHIGYANLIEINSMSWLRGQHIETGVPRADFELISQYGDGLVCLSGDLDSELNQAILRDDIEAAKAIARRYHSRFGDDYYIEIMNNALPETAKCRAASIAIARELGIALVATNDCHCIDQSDAQALATLLRIQLGNSVNVGRLMAHGLDQLYLRSAEEMWELFSDVPDACENTVKIAEKCDFSMPFGESDYLPTYDVPLEFVQARGFANKMAALDEYFVHVSREGLAARFAEFESRDIEFDRAAYQARLQTEIEVIRNFDFPGIFLIVWDAIRWAKMHDIRVGPGRGTSASSLVAYSLQITDIDPIEHSLLFERFLNPKHITRPDFDVDICRQRRGEVVAYLQHKYGHDNVGQIIAFDRLKGRGCIRAAGRALNYSSSEIARIASLVPDASYVTLQHALAQEPKLHDLCAKDLWAHQLFEIALRLENLNSEVGTHPVGVVISGEPLWKVVPVCRVPNGQEGEIVTQYDMNDVERVGLVKFDFLDSQCLTVIGETVKFINLRRAKASHVPPALHSVLATKATEAIETFDLRQISMCDPAVFRELSMGNTTGVFQFEWSGCRTFFKQLKPDCFEDIVAAGALYRPGPLYSGMVDDIVDRKHGRTNIEIPHPWLKEVLKPTYGIIVYQEQLTRAIQVMAGYSLGDAELLRRAMATKKPLLMAQHRRTFVDGAVKLNVPSEQAEVIFDVMVHYAGYAFNKSHAAAYALMTVQTAWLKSHYPGEFMAALMKSEHDNSNMMICLINEAKRMAVDVLPPSVNESEVDINVIDGKIRFGLGDIKGVGAEVVEAIFSARQTGPFKSLRDFCRRVGMKQLNSRTLEALVKTGAFDSIAAGLDGSTNIADIGRARSAMFAAIELVMDEFAQRQHHTGVGLSSLFAMLEAPSPEDLRGDPQPAFSAWREREVLDFEKQHLGLYVTGHPLDHYAADVARHGAASIFDISSPDYEPDDEHQVLLAGVVTRLQQWPSTPGGGSTAIVRFEDKTGAVDVLVSSIQFGMFEDILKCGSRVFIRGELLGKFGADGFCQKIRAKQVTLLSDVFPHVNE